ncbi:MAG: homoserine kinase [Erythrobacter sp.]
MAVYTHLGAEDLAELIAHYNVGELVSAKGIAEGVSNSNWLIETTGISGSGSRFILTMYERRIDVAELPFFLGLLDHLADQGCPVPRTIHDSSGASHRQVDGKSIALIEYLPGVSVDRPTPAQAESVGKALAQTHLAAQSFDQARPQSLGLPEWKRVLEACGKDALASIHADLPEMCSGELEYLTAHWPSMLPSGVTHCDLFPDNVLMLEETVSGLIDFYFAANDFFAYDLAVTHAAWCFDRENGAFRSDIATSLMRGYNSVRLLGDEEHAALPILARGAAMRFISSRADDWLNTPQDALVSRKDPMDFVQRLEFYRGAGQDIFA